MKKIKVSEMNIGDYGLYNGDIVRLKNNGLSGGADTDLYLAYVCTIGDEYDGERGNPNSADLPKIIMDTNKVTA